MYKNYIRFKKIKIIEKRKEKKKEEERKKEKKGKLHTTAIAQCRGRGFITTIESVTEYAHIHIDP